MALASEFKRALAETAPYLLAHHEQSERYRCYAPVVFGRRVHVCARCSGVYPGIISGFAVAMLAPGHFTTLAVVASLPAPALVDWVVTSIGDRQGINSVRTVTGALLGYAYGVGLVRLLFGGDPLVLAIGFGYAVLTGAALAYERR